MAVYVHLSADDFHRVADAFPVGEVLAFHGITDGIENTNYKLETTTGDYIASLYGKRVNPEFLPFYMQLMAHLAAKGLPCPAPVHQHTGELIYWHGEHALTLVSFLQGKWLKQNTATHCRNLGIMLAKMHQAGKDAPVDHHPNPLGIDYWAQSFAACEVRMEEVHPLIADAVKDGMTRVRQQWTNDLPSGLIHADLFPDNVLWVGEEVTGLIDFYAACHDIYLYDIAICLNSWCSAADGTWDVTKASALLAGYESIRPLAPEEKQALPVVATGAALRFLCSRLYDWLHRIPGAQVVVKDPLEYLRLLQYHLKIQSYHEYGLQHPVHNVCIH